MDEREPSTIDVFIDFLPNQSRETLGKILRERFAQRLDASVDRLLDLPRLMLQQPANEYATLLCEARDLFISGHFYSCVAMCGIVGERLVKDIVRASVLIRDDAGRVGRPAETAFNQLEHIDSSSLCRFLKEAQLLNDEAAKAANELCQLRNRYAHARGKDAQGDAVKAIRLLHMVVEDTVSVLKDFVIRNGTLVMKDMSPKTQGPK